MTKPTTKEKLIEDQIDYLDELHREYQSDANHAKWVEGAKEVLSQAHTAGRNAEREKLREWVEGMEKEAYLDRSTWEEDMTKLDNVVKEICSVSVTAAPKSKVRRIVEAFEQEVREDERGRVSKAGYDAVDPQDWFYKVSKYLNQSDK